eukprot:gene13583-14989_t
MSGISTVAKPILATMFNKAKELVHGDPLLLSLNQHSTMHQSLRTSAQPCSKEGKFTSVHHFFYEARQKTRPAPTDHK